MAAYDWSYEGADSIICQAEIKDAATQTSTITNLSSPEYWDYWLKRNASEIGDKIAFMNDTVSIIQ